MNIPTPGASSSKHLNCETQKFKLSKFAVIDLDFIESLAFFGFLQDPS